MQLRQQDILISTHEFDPWTVGVDMPDAPTKRRGLCLGQIGPIPPEKADGAAGQRCEAAAEIGKFAHPGRVSHLDERQITRIEAKIDRNRGKIDLWQRVSGEQF
jgi:hypothetical protein